MSLLHKKDDLTRWNRTGLNRFRYVEGNAVTYLEALRLAMVEAFTQPDGSHQWAELNNAIPMESNETPSERRARWLQQYRDERRDYGWEILRSTARASHVLTEHLDAYANESYIGTATQWDSVRRLVEMLDYHPAPPASAETPIVLLAKEDKAGTVSTGFAFKNRPEDGSKPAVFETLDDLDVAAEMNQLRPAQWDRSQLTFNYSSGSYSATFPLIEAVDGVAVGTQGVLLIEKSNGSEVGLYVKVTSISDDALELQGESKPSAFPSRVKRHQVRLLLKPDFKQSPQLSGSNVALLSEEHGLVEMAMVAWEARFVRDGRRIVRWRIALVEAVEGARVKFSRAAPAIGTLLYLASYADAPVSNSGNTGQKRLILPSHRADARKSDALWDADLNRIRRHYHAIEGSVYLYDYIVDDAINRAYYVPVADAIATVQESRLQGINLDGEPGNLSGGDWIIAKASGGSRAASITEINEGEKSFELELSRALGGIETLYGRFELELYPLDYNINADPVFETDPLLRSDSHSYIPLALDEIPDLLEIGRQLIIAGKDAAMLVTLKAVDRVAKCIKVEPAIPGSELDSSGTSDNYSRYATIIYGNVVQSGHGESQGEKILGSGDAAKSRQSFDLAVEEVSFVADSNFASGVRAALDITVGNRTWEQVSVLSDSQAEDPHYVVRMSEDGTLNIIFGDGRNGRRLPTASNNVRATHRVGVGLSGNLDPFNLKKAVKPHHLIDELTQPIPSSGGNAMEEVTSMRENAPASVLTLDRAVSLADFTHLATSNSSVWQALAIRLQPGMARKDKVEVVVVPAGGGSLGTLKETLQSTLSQHALPGVSISVTPFKSIILDLTIMVRIKQEEFDTDFVVENLRQALFEAFTLKWAKLGVPLFRSQVIEVVEGVEGVENCDCIINPNGFNDESGAVVTPQRVISGSDGVIKRVSLDARQVIYLEEDLSKLEIIPQAFSL